MDGLNNSRLRKQSDVPLPWPAATLAASWAGKGLPGEFLPDSIGKWYYTEHFTGPYELTSLVSRHASESSSRTLGRLHPRQFVTIAVVCCCFALAAKAQTYQYMLEPGSTITRYLGVTPIGPTEPLTGTFTWAPAGYDGEWDEYYWQTSELDFQSPSYHLTLYPST